LDERKINQSQSPSFTGIPVHDDFEITEANTAINIYKHISNIFWEVKSSGSFMMKPMSTQ
jgi:hypothetical protein